VNPLPRPCPLPGRRGGRGRRRAALRRGRHAAGWAHESEKAQARRNVTANIVTWGLWCTWGLGPTCTRPGTRSNEAVYTIRHTYVVNAADSCCADTDKPTAVVGMRTDVHQVCRTATPLREGQTEGARQSNCRSAALRRRTRRSRARRCPAGWSAPAAAATPAAAGAAAAAGLAAAVRAAAGCVGPHRSLQARPPDISLGTASHYETLQVYCISRRSLPQRIGKRLTACCKATGTCLGRRGAMVAAMPVVLPLRIVRGFRCFLLLLLGYHCVQHRRRLGGRAHAASPVVFRLCCRVGILGTRRAGVMPPAAVAVVPSAAAAVPAAAAAVAAVLPAAVPFPASGVCTAVSVLRMPASTAARLVPTAVSAALSGAVRPAAGCVSCAVAGPARAPAVPAAVAPPLARMAAVALSLRHLNARLTQDPRQVLSVLCTRLSASRVSRQTQLDLTQTRVAERRHPNVSNLTSTAKQTLAVRPLRLAIPRDASLKCRSRKFLHSASSSRVPHRIPFSITFHQQISFGKVVQ